MKILLTGASGFIGQALAARLADEGHSISALPRYSGTPFEIPDCDAVMNLAGASIAQWPWTAQRKQWVWNSRVASTRALVSALGKMARRPRVLISVSGMGYYGDSGDRRVQIGDPPGGDFLGRLAAAWEQEALRAEQLGLRVVLPRLGLVIGPRGGALPRITLPFRFGLGAVFGSGQQYFPWIHRDDVTDLISRSLEEESWAGPLHAVAGEPITQRAFAETLAKVLQRPLWFRFPEFALRMGLGEMADLFLHGQRAMPNASDFQPRFPNLESALSNVL